MAYEPRYVHRVLQIHIGSDLSVRLLLAISIAPETKGVISRSCWSSWLVTVVETGINAAAYQSFAILQRWYRITLASGDTAICEHHQLAVAALTRVLPRRLSIDCLNIYDEMNMYKIKQEGRPKIESPRCSIEEKELGV